MHYLRVGNYFLNMSLVTSIYKWEDPVGCTVLGVCFAGEREALRLNKPEDVQLLWDWLDRAKMNVTRMGAVTSRQT